MALPFEWDARKDVANQEKHTGVDTPPDPADVLGKVLLSLAALRTSAAIF